MYGVKTGFTNGANRCLVTAVKRENMDIICVVLGADTKKDRTRDSIKLIEYAFSNFQMIDIEYMMIDEFENKVSITKFNIIKGINNNLEIRLEENSVGLYPVYKDKIKDIKIDVEIKETLSSPVYEGQVVGLLQVKIGEEVIYEINIVTKNSINKRGVIDYYNLFFKNLSEYLNINYSVNS